MAKNSWLGLTVTDRITGFRGIVVGYFESINGQKQCLVETGTKKCQTKKETWFDVQRLVVDANRERIELNNGKTPGSDRAAPKR